ncbi:MAG TPA: VCBS repeat-containing protein [Gaiellaceae bacterium]|nr:VCBS repeat-containing protein [Gaiellaceae bacterium]
MLQPAGIVSPRVAVTVLLVASSLALAGAAPAHERALTCAAAGGRAAVQAPRFVRNIATGETGWFASPGLVDLNGDGKLEIVAPFYSTFVFDAKGRLLGKGTATKGRVYAPGVVADLDGDKLPEIVVGGNEGTVAAYDLTGGQLRLKAGWPASTCSGGQCPEVRGLAAADLDGDGRVEVVATTTNTSSSGSQVFVFDASGHAYHPKGAPTTSWPRYNQLHGAGNDADFNGVGNHGYGAYGENVGIGNVDDDPQLEIVVTFDNHQINVFNDDGTSVLASPWFTNRQSGDTGRRLGWGQFIRWLSPTVELNHYHRHTGPWPDVRVTPWLQWTASPPTVADLDRDGHNEVIGLPNIEKKEPYETQGYAFMAFDGAQNGGARSAMRHKGFVAPPVSSKPAVRPDGDWYPPSGIPAPTVVNISGDARPEIVAAVPDGYVYAISPDGRRLWRYHYAHGAPKTFASEVVAADLNRDGKPELIFGTYALTPGAGRLIVLSSAGKLLYDVKLPHQGRDGNGIGVPAAPSVGDLDGDGTLEIVLSAFDHGIDVFHVPGSGTNCLPWPTGRANLLRNGLGPAAAS